MKTKLLLLVGAAVGYVLGTRAGRDRYEQIKQSATKVWNDPKVQEKVSEAEQVVREKGPEVKEKVSEAAQHATEAAKDASESVRDAAQHAKDAAKERVSSDDSTS